MKSKLPAIILPIFLITFTLSSEAQWKCGTWDSMLAGPPEISSGNAKFLFKSFDGTGKLQWKSNALLPFDLQLSKYECLEYLYPYPIDQDLYAIVKLRTGKNQHFGSMILVKISIKTGSVIWKTDLNQLGIQPSNPQSVTLKNNRLLISWKNKDISINPISGRLTIN